ncbi:MAG TPA: hypothetical protein VGK32_02640 [Vicinamibacterales bacterium]|jgi:hypothetical protein
MSDRYDLTGTLAFLLNLEPDTPAWLTLTGMSRDELIRSVAVAAVVVRLSINAATAHPDAVRLLTALDADIPREEQP